MLKKIILAVLVFCVALSCISCTTAESRDIASNMAGKTFKGKIEFDYGPDWEVTWKFSEDTVKVITEYPDAKGLPVTEVDDFNYKVTGTYKKAMAVFPNTKAWNDVRIFFDASGDIYYIEHTDSVGTSRFYIYD